MNKLELRVSGIHCDGCERRIEAALGQIDGVVRSDADHESGTVTVTIDPSKTSEDAVRASIARAGFAPI